MPDATTSPPAAATPDGYMTDAQLAHVALTQEVQDLLKDGAKAAPDLLALVRAYKSGDRATLLRFFPALKGDADAIEKDVAAIVPQVRNHLKDPSLYVAIALGAAPWVDKAVSATQGHPALHAACVVASGLIVVAMKFGKL